MSETNKMAVIGDKDSVMAFRALGVRVFSDLNPFAVRETIKRLAHDGCPLILITEKAAEEVPDALAKYKTVAYPVIIPIPDSTGATGFGMQGLKHDIEKAIGTDIIFK